VGIRCEAALFIGLLGSTLCTTRILSRSAAGLEQGSVSIRISKDFWLGKSFFGDSMKKTSPVGVG
jgi:hypothetical protein